MMKRIVFYTCALVICAALVLMLKPAIDASRVRTRGHNRLDRGMSSLGKALLMHAMDNDERFPPDLQTLVNEDLIKPEQMCYPWLDTGPETNVTEWTSIIYFPGFTVADSGEEVVAVTLPVQRDGGKFPAYALRLDGSMFLPTDEELPRILNRGIERLAPTNGFTVPTGARGRAPAVP